MVTVYGLAYAPPTWVVDLAFVTSALLPLRLRHGRRTCVFFKRKEYTIKYGLRMNFEMDTCRLEML